MGVLLGRGVVTEFEPIWRWPGLLVALLVAALAVAVAVPTVLTVSVSTAAGLLTWAATSSGDGPGPDDSPGPPDNPA
ncbi:MAG: hypothetical protein K2X82_05540 [Gemmataceae bacterium]|nr:hypothetical protein [Gemmataceae bacterium]